MAVDGRTLKRGFDTQRMASLIERFAKFGKNKGEGVTRLAFSDEDRQAREEFFKILKTEFNFEIRTDALGNIFARREGRHADLPVIMTGSHLDSVRNGGKYDGPAGVFSSLEAFRAMDLLGIVTDHPFELCVLSSEEPNTFGISTFGSRGMIGALKKEHVEHLQNDQGDNFHDALKNIGGNLHQMDEAVRSLDEIKYFLELHIEQMPTLDRDNIDIGVVEGVTGIYREEITVVGEASHCGTTPMDIRRDALCAAAEIILKLETAAREEDDHAVATVGRITAFPNSINITPGRVVFDMEVRSYDAERIGRITEKMDHCIKTALGRRQIKVDRKVTYDSKPVHFSSNVKQAIAQAADNLGFSTRHLVSMAGHDAAHVNRISEAGMIFIPCRDGLSHCPQEYTKTESILKGAQCLLETLLLLDQQKGEG